MRNIASNVLTILIVVGLVFVGALGLAKQEIVSPGPLREEVTVQVPRGASPRDISELLAEAGALPDRGVLGIVDGATLFRLATRYAGKSQSLKFGEYAIAPGASVEELVTLLSTGANVQHTVTIPEGMTSAMAVDVLNGAELLTGEVAELPAEGSLFPDTWSFQRGTPRQALVEQMQAKMRQVLDTAWENRVPGLPLQSKDELLILASIVEKETTPAEHGKVASVFINRLRLGMRLQTDPTVIYGITEGKAPLGRGLRRSELRAATPYNTYVIAGLPPTPIANPSQASIEAVANPDETPYLYFVADGTGGHAFARTLDEHNRNVAVWRRIERQRQQEQQQ
ncbi:MAG: endolytic transglycosylase MltG [Pseudomonadota bacterium]